MTHIFGSVRKTLALFAATAVLLGGALASCEQSAGGKGMSQGGNDDSPYYRSVVVDLP
jgi:hypothetical protein